MFKIGDRAVVVESKGLRSLIHYYEVGTEVEILDLTGKKNDTILFCTDNDSRMPMKQHVLKHQLRLILKDAHVCPTCERS